MSRTGYAIPGFVILFMFVTGLHGQDLRKPSRSVTDPGVITTRQAITPAGVQSVFDGRVYGLTFAGKATEVAVMTYDQKTGTASSQPNRLDEQPGCGAGVDPTARPDCKDSSSIRHRA